MEFNEFIQAVGGKIGPKNAFDISRDARTTAIEKLLVSKGLVTQEEITESLSKEFDLISENISRMPPLPNENK